jgi:hypothetical protein
MEESVKLIIRTGLSFENQEDQSMRLFLLVVLAIASVWDAFTTVYGTIQILGNAPLQIMAALLFSALIFGFVLNTRTIMRWHSGFMSGITKFFWFVALSYDLFTSWVGNSNLILRSRNMEAATFIILVGLTLLVTASPILLSAFWQSRSLSSQDAEMRRA